jgi:hypothetical protein
MIGSNAQSDIFIGRQNLCRNGFRPRDGRLSSKDSTQLAEKRLYGNTCFLLSGIYYRGNLGSNPRSDIFFGRQTQCVNDCRPHDWRLSSKDSTQLVQKWPNGNTCFLLSGIYYRGSERMPRVIYFSADKLSVEMIVDVMIDDWAQKIPLSLLKNSLMETLVFRFLAFIIEDRI